MWYSGGYLSPAGWLPGIIVIILGSFVGSIIFATAGVLGSQMGTPSMVTVRASFGIRGSYLMSALNYITLLGWTAWMININASAAETIVSLLFSITAFPYWLVICGAACTALSLFRAGVWKWFTRISVTALIAITLAINVVVFSNYGWDYLSSRPSSGMPLGIVFDLALIIPLSWAPLAADYNRFARSTKGGFFGSLLGQSSVNAWFFITGLACALAFGMYDPTVYVTQIGGIIFGMLALFVIWFGTVTTTFLDIYSANMSIINISPKIKEWQGSIITGIAGTIIAFLPWLGAFVQFLYLIGALFVPLFAIVLTDYFIMRKGDSPIDDLYSLTGKHRHIWGICPAAIISWVVGVAFYFWLLQAFPYLGATMPAFAITIPIYIVMCKIFRC